MRREVHLTAGAERDLEEIHDYLNRHESRAVADRVLDRLVAVAETLSAFPERGVHPEELLALGIREYRQLVFEPYRVIYRVIEPRVFVYIIVDGRRDMQSLLARRLLAG
jgi:toxin ParE1/3/4